MTLHACLKFLNQVGHVLDIKVDGDGVALRIIRSVLNQGRYVLDNLVSLKW